MKTFGFSLALASVLLIAAGNEKADARGFAVAFHGGHGIGGVGGFRGGFFNAGFNGAFFGGRRGAVIINNGFGGGILPPVAGVGFRGGFHRGVGFNRVGFVGAAGYAYGGNVGVPLGMAYQQQGIGFADPGYSFHRVGLAAAGCGAVDVAPPVALPAPQGNYGAALEQLQAPVTTTTTTVITQGGGYSLRRVGTPVCP